MPSKSFGTEVYFCVVLPWGVALAVAYESHTSLVAAPAPWEGPEVTVVLEAFGPWGSFETSGSLVLWVVSEPSVVPLAGSSAPLIG